MYDIYRRVCLLILLLGSTCCSANDTLKCTFECRKFKTRAEAAAHRLPPRTVAMPRCFAYCFWARGQGAAREYIHFANSPAKVDENGVCNFPFSRNATYYIYFSGRELSVDDIKAVAERRSHVLLRIVMQPRSPIAAADTQPEVNEYRRGHLRVTFRQSFARWMALLHHVEANGGSAGSVLTSVRKLLYDNDQWNTLIDRQSVPPLLTFNTTTGVASVADGYDLQILQGLSHRHKLIAGSTLKYALDKDGDRTIVERNEFVTLPDGRTVQMFHVLSGIESQLYGPANSWQVRFGFAPQDHVAAVTWSGDLAQAACLVRSDVTQEKIPDNKWKAALRATALDSELLGDIAGVFLGNTTGDSLKTGKLLSHVLEDSFYGRDWGSNAADHFATRYSNKDIREAIGDFAVRWCTTKWNTDGWFFKKSGADEKKILDRSLEELNRILKEMSSRGEKSSQQSSRIFNLKDIRSGIQFERESRVLMKQPDRLADSGQKLRSLFASELPDDILNTTESLSLLHSRARLPRDQETFLELMNLASFEEKMARDNAAETVKSHSNLLRHILFAADEKTMPVTLQEVKSRLDSLKRLRKLCLTGIDPVRGPTTEEADNFLVSAGLPPGFPRTVSAPRLKRIKQSDKTNLYWVVDVDLDLGFGEERPLSLKGIPVAFHKRILHTSNGDRHIEAGYWLDRKSVIVDINSRLSLVGSEGRSIAIGKSTFLLERLWVSDGELFGDWTLHLLGDPESALSLQRIQPQLSNGRFHWFAESLPTLPQSLTADLLPAAMLPLVDFGNGRPKLRRILSRKEAGLLSEAIATSLVRGMSPTVQRALRQNASLPKGRFGVGQLQVTSSDPRFSFLLGSVGPYYYDEEGDLHVRRDLSQEETVALKEELRNSVSITAERIALRASGFNSSLELSSLKKKPEAANLDTLFHRTNAPAVFLQEIPDKALSFVRVQQRGRGPPIGPTLQKAIETLGSELRAAPDQLRSWKVSLDDDDLSAIREAGGSSEFDCVCEVDGNILQVGPVIALSHGKLIKTRRDVASFLAVDSIRVLHSVRQGKEVDDAVTDALKSLQESLRTDPNEILKWSSESAKPDGQVICTAEVIVNSCGELYSVGPIRVSRTRGTDVDVKAKRSEVRALVGNKDVLIDFIRKNIPLFGAVDERREFKIANMRLRLDKGDILVVAEWSSSLFTDPVKLEMHVPLAGQQAFDGAGVLRKALSNKTLNVGSHLSVQCGDLVGRDDWPADLVVGSENVSISLEFDDGKLGIGLEPTAIQRLVPPALKSTLSQFGVSGPLKLSDVRLDVPKDGSSAAIHAAIIWELGGDQFEVLTRIDRYGMHVQSWEGLVLQLARKAFGKSNDWPVRVSKISIVDDEVTCDAQLMIDEDPVISIYGAKFKQGMLDGGAITVSPAFAEKWSTESLSDAFRITNVRVAGRNVVCDVAIELQPLEPIRLKSLPLQGGVNRADALVEACIPQLLAAIKPSRSVEVGGFTISLKPASAGDAVVVSAKVDDPEIAITWPKVTLSTNGLSLGKGVLESPREAEVKEQLSALFAQAADVRSEAVSISSFAVAGTQLSDLKVVFDVSVNLQNGRATITGNELGAGGVALGNLPDLSDVARAAVNKAIDEFASWVVGAEIDLGVVKVKVTKVDRGLRTALGAIVLQNQDVGVLAATFDTSGKPQFTIEKPDEFLANVAKITQLGDLPVGEGKAVRIISTNLVENRIETSLEFLVPILEEYVPIGSVAIDKAGVRFDADDGWEEALWKSIAPKVSGKSISNESLPVNLSVVKATALPSGLLLDLECKVEGLGEFSLTGVRLDRNGVDIDEQVVFTNLANLVSAKVQESLGDSVCSLHNVAANGDEIEITVLLTVDGMEPFPLKVTIGKDGSLRGFDERALLGPFLKELSAELKGKLFELPGDIKLTIDGTSLAADLDGINVHGSITAFEAVTAKVKNVVFKGRSFDTSNMELAEFKVAGLSEALGLADLGDNGVAIKNFGPLFGENNRLEGVTLTASCKIAEVLEAEVNASIGQNGIKVQLPITLVANGVTIPVPPCFALSRWKAQIAETHLGVGCSLGLTIPQSEKLIRIDGLLKFPLKPPRQISAEADIVLLSFLRPGHSEVVLDLDASELRALMKIDLFRVMSFDGRFLARMQPDDFLLEGNGELIFLGSTLASGYMKIDAVVFVGHGQLSILGVNAKAGLDGKWKDVLDTTVSAEVGFDLPLVGRIVGSDVKGNPKRGAEFGATILSQRIQLAAIDFEGITKERILDILFQDSIIPTGLKLLATEGGGGSVFVAKDGSLVKIDPDSGEFTSVSEMGGALVLRRGSVEDGGNPDDPTDHIITEDVVIPASNQIVTVVRNGKGQELQPPRPRPYTPGTTVDPREELKVPQILVDETE